jgi:glyoxylate reductase
LPARPRVHLTAPVPREVAGALEGDFDLVDSPEGADGILVALTARVDERYLERAGPQLRVVANYAVGVNNIDLDATAARGVVVTNTPDVLTRATAELAVGLMLALLRRIAEGDRFIRRDSEWEFSLEFMLGSSLDGKELLIVGPGRIGRETARLAEAFGARSASTHSIPIATRVSRVALPRCGVRTTFSSESSPSSTSGSRS